MCAREPSWKPANTFWIDAPAPTLCGITPGNGAPDPGSTDLSASMPLNSGTQATIYEEWLIPPPFDLAGRSILFIP